MSEEKEKKQEEISPEEKLLKSIFGDNATQKAYKTIVKIITSQQGQTFVFQDLQNHNLNISYQPRQDIFEIHDDNTKTSVSFNSLTVVVLVEILLKYLLNAKVIEEERKQSVQSSFWNEIVGGIENWNEIVRGIENWNEIVKGIEKLKGYIKSNKNKEADVYIAIPQKDTDLFQVESLQNAVGGLMEALGYEMETKEEPILGSFFQRLKFLLKEPKTQEELAKAYKIVKLAAETKYVGNPTADETQKIADATAKLIEAASKFDTVVIRAERILLVKAEINGKTHLKVQTLSPTLMQLLDEQPQLMDNPELMMQLISNKQSKPKALEGGETPAITGT